MILINDVKTKLSDLVQEVSIAQRDSFLNVEPISDATEDSLVFANNEKFLKQALDSAAQVIVTNIKLKELCSESNKSFIFANIPDLLVTKILQTYFYSQKIAQQKASVSKSANIHESANVHESCFIGENVVIGKNVQIAENCFVGANTVIENDVQIAIDTEIHSQCFIGQRTEIGEACIIRAASSIGSLSMFHFTSDEDGLGKVVLKNFVELGSQSCIDRPTRSETFIGESCKLDNLVKISAGAYLDNFCLITAGVQIGHNARCGKYFTVGGNSFIEPNTVIADQVLCGGMTFVDRDITEKGQYGGMPVQPMKDYLRSMVSLAQIPKLRKILKTNA